MSAQKGTSLFDQGRYDEAKAEFEKALSLNPNDAETHNGLGRVALVQQRYEDAEQFFRKASELVPKEPVYHHNLGWALHNLKRYDEAIREYQKATEIDPNYALAYNNWGLALYDQEKYPEAIEKYQKATEIDPQYADAYNNWGNVLYAQKRYEEAIEKYQQAVMIDPSDADAHNGLGRVALEQRRYEDAEQAFRRAIELNPEEAVYRHNLGLALENIGRYPETEEKPEIPLPEEKLARPTAQAAHPAPTLRPPDLRMLADEPLRDDVGDRLDFKPYANALAGLINNPKTKTPLTLAINAPWGAGKSTLALMIQRRLEGKPALGGKRPHVTCWFNAWMHDDAPNLASAFSAEIAHAANYNRSFWRRVLQPLPSAILHPADRLQRRMIVVFSLLIMAFLFTRWLGPHITVPKDSKDLLDQIFLAVGPQKSLFAVMVGILALLAKLVPVMAPLAKSLAGFINDPKDAAITASMKQVSDQLGKLIKQATPPGSRFVIFVDDIERCQAPRSVDVLEVVNQLLGHEGVVTVLMADMPAVAACAQIKYEKLARIYTPSGIPSANGGGRAYGRAYLQKIIQLQFDLPPYLPAKIHSLAQTLVKEPAEPPATAEVSDFLASKKWRARLVEWLHSLETGEAWDQLRQRFRKHLAILLEFLTNRSTRLRDLFRLVPATADWQQGFGLRDELRRLHSERPRVLLPARMIVWLLFALPRWVVSKIDQWVYPRPLGWSAFWPGRTWRGFSWVLDALCFLYLLSLAGFMAMMLAIRDVLDLGAAVAMMPPIRDLLDFVIDVGVRLAMRYESGLLEDVFLGRVSLLFAFHLALLAAVLLLIPTLAWFRSRLQQRRDSTVLLRAGQLLSKRPPDSRVDSKEFQAEVVQAIGVKVNEDLLQEEIRAYVADESELRREAEDEIMNYLPPLPRNAKRVPNRLRLLLAVAYERKMFGDTSTLSPRHIGKWAVLCERWPELAQQLCSRPDEMRTSEDKAAHSNKAVFEKYIRKLAPDYAVDEALREFCQSSPQLGSVMERLVYFEPAEQQANTAA